MTQFKEYKADGEFVLHPDGTVRYDGLSPRAADIIAELLTYQSILESEKGEGGWQPIETAPKNVSVLVYIPNAEHYGEGIYRAILVDMRPTLRAPHWTTTGLHVGRDIGADCQPTHWMPLPAPPADHT